MRTTLSIVILQLTAMIVLAAIAVAQSEETFAPPNPLVEQDNGAKHVEDAKVDGDAKQEVESAQKGNTISSLFKRLDDAYLAIEKIKVEIEKIDARHNEAVQAAAKASPLVRAMPKSTQEQPSSSIPSPPAIPNIPAPAKAEVDGSESFDSVAGGISSVEAAGKYIDTMPIPVLNGSTPEWVKNGLVLGEEHSALVPGEDHSFAISSTLMSDLEQCREDLKTRMMSEVRDYLDKHVLQFAEALRLPELTQEYVEKYWVKKGQVFDNIQDRPAGNYHQLWIGLHISSEQLTKIREWEKQTVREQRTRKVGIFGGLGVCAITLLSGAVGLLARREKAKLKG
ncbi:MAG: hypothetical protein NTY15_02380 [Planctomycetota bacterium]|nr:hypothetical protein [Planctomycetota bacterium]